MVAGGGGCRPFDTATSASALVRVPSIYTLQSKFEFHCSQQCARCTRSSTQVEHPLFTAIPSALKVGANCLDRDRDAVQSQAANWSGAMAAGASRQARRSIGSTSDCLDCLVEAVRAKVVPSRHTLFRKSIALAGLTLPANWRQMQMSGRSVIMSGKCGWSVTSFEIQLRHGVHMPLSHGTPRLSFAGELRRQGILSQASRGERQQRTDLSRCDCAIATLFMPFAHRLLLAEREFYDFASCAAWRNGHRLRF